jgi:hypothetical protein
MARFHRRTISNDLEKQIAIGLITSKQFCAEIIQSVNSDYFKIDYAQLVVKWACDFYKKYKTPIGKSIEDVFKTEKEELEDETAELIATFLANISTKYETEGFNSDYYADQAREYFAIRSMEILFEKGKSALEAKNFKLAESLIRDHSKIREKTTEIFNPFDPDEIRRHDPESEKLFSFDGALGKLLGPFCAKWLVAISAPEKRGKSYFLDEILMQGISHKKKACVVLFEMGKTAKKQRLYSRITGKPAEFVENLIFPVFDCEYNQFGTCKNKKRRNKITLINEDGEKPDFDPKMEYQVCTYCRERKKFDKYRLEYWFYSQGKTQKASTKEIVEKAETIRRLYGDNVRIIKFPAYSANFDDVEAAVDDLEQSEGFIPDFYIFDYFDIMGKEEGRFLSERDRINATWVRGTAFAHKKNACVFTADQTTKGARQKLSVASDDTSEDKRKDAHLDVRIALNRTPLEKEHGIMRASVLFHRHMKYNERREVIILQSLDAGQSLLDCEFWPFDKEIR